VTEDLEDPVGVTDLGAHFARSEWLLSDQIDVAVRVPAR
jgi:hypothetical protein